ncbi:hypothetical protein LCGC14_1502490 [marine sediment metagenome]|uniref:Zinc-ribbon domain-containing protein n=1 Tax=marine sediment metagenome TaxID=412755 RepID=A0A0F9J478_9ZZZZ
MFIQEPALNIGKSFHLCPNCGLKNVEKAKFCTDCGFDILNESKSRESILDDNLSEFIIDDDSSDYMIDRNSSIEDILLVLLHKNKGNTFTIKVLKTQLENLIENNMKKKYMQNNIATILETMDHRGRIQQVQKEDGLYFLL